VWLGASLFPHSDPEAMEETLNRLDGLLLAGGADVDPREAAYFLPDGGTLDPDALHILSEPERDAYELPLARKALERDMPIFGICRGFQVLNVLCGGTLVPDLRTGIRHRAYSEALSSSHLIRTVPGSAIDRLIGGGFAPVNSRHHQGVLDESAAPCFQVTACAHDGIAETLEDPSRPWRFAVQWHPERGQERTLHERDLRIFRLFTEECRRR
jgi:putative glutamine amidotransferase